MSNKFEFQGILTDQTPY